MFVKLFVAIFLALPLTKATRWDKDHYHEMPQDQCQGQCERGQGHAGSYNDFLNPPGEGLITDWKELGNARIAEANEAIRKIADLNKPAKNIIFMMADGMGVPTLSAARIYLAQTRNLVGDDALLAWERLPFAALSKTYSTDYQVADSASTATAMVCGEKTGSGYIALNQFARYNNCSSQLGNEIPSIMSLVLDDSVGKRAGVISTARVTHASPSCCYAHAANRNWEADSDLPDDAVGICPDIASQFVDIPLNNRINVFLGGGRQMFFPDTTPDLEYPDKTGARSDNRDLIQEWKDIKLAEGLVEDVDFAYVINEDEFQAVDVESMDYLVGLFERGHMQFELDRENDTMGEPSLADMVERGIDILSKEDNGYFLFVEAGRVDHAHHNNWAQKALGEAVAFSDAVQRAMDMTDENDTMIIVTADHSHAFAFAGYPKIDTNILQYDIDEQFGVDDKPYTTLGYTNGPGFYAHRTEDGELSSETPRRDLEPLYDQLLNKNFPSDAGVPLSSETHGGDDVAIFARGPMAHLFMGTQEQSYIGNVMMYAFCVGDNTELCDE